MVEHTPRVDGIPALWYTLKFATLQKRQLSRMVDDIIFEKKINTTANLRRNICLNLGYSL